MKVKRRAQLLSDTASIQTEVGHSVLLHAVNLIFVYKLPQIGRYALRRKTRQLGDLRNEVGGGVEHVPLHTVQQRLHIERILVFRALNTGQRGALGEEGALFHLRGNKAFLAACLLGGFGKRRVILLLCSGDACVGVRRHRCGALNSGLLLLFLSRLKETQRFQRCRCFGFQRVCLRKGLLMQEIRSRFSISTVGAFTYAGNAASIRVLEKCGFIQQEAFTEDGRESLYYETK